MVLMMPGPGNRAVPLARLIPNLLTTISLCSGLAAIHFALKEAWPQALLAVVVAAIFDVLDGRAARLLRVTSPFGAVLDSLSDFLSFGVAPALILHQWMLKDAGVFGLAAVMTYVLCAALRLARFTAEPISEKPGGRTVVKKPQSAAFFTGMPSPAAAGVVLIPALLYVSDANITAPDWAVTIHTIVVGTLMISRIPMFSIKKIRVQGTFVPLLILIVGLLVVLMTRYPWLTLVSICSLYVALMPVSVIAARRRAASATTDDDDAADDGADGHTSDDEDTDPEIAVLSERDGRNSHRR